MDKMINLHIKVPEQLFKQIKKDLNKTEDVEVIQESFSLLKWVVEKNGYDTSGSFVIEIASKKQKMAKELWHGLIQKVINR